MQCIQPGHTKTYAEFFPYIVDSAPIGNGTCCRTLTMAAPILLTSGLVRYKSVLHGCCTRSVRVGWYRLVIVHTYGDSIVLPQWNIRPPSP